jgi:hypothetical protein
MNGLPHPTTRLPGATRSRNSGVVVEIEVVYCIIGCTIVEWVPYSCCINRVCNITLFGNVNWMVLSLAYYICFQMLLPQMSSKTRSQDAAGTSSGRESTPNPPPVPPTLAKAIAAMVNATADNTRFLREMAGQQFQQQGGRSYQQAPVKPLTWTSQRHVHRCLSKPKTR